MDEPTKRCCTCHVVQPVSQFNVRRAARDGLQSRCRSCNSAWYAENRDDHKANVRRRNTRVRIEVRTLLCDYLLGHPCVDCGETDVRCLDFDHRDPSAKKAAVGRLAGQALPWKDVLAEIAKCDVRCANCHRRLTAQQWSWRRQVVQAGVETARRQASLERLARVLPRPPGTVQG